MDQNTYLLNLSSAVQAAVNNFQAAELLSTTNELLSTVQQLSSIPTFSELNDLINSLSSIPLHPYQNLLWKHFDPDHQFKTFDDIPEPEKIPTKECLDYINKKEQEINKTLFHNLTAAPEQQVTSIFDTLSGEQVICNIEKQKSYLEFIEMLKQIPLDSITSENSTSLTKKIIAEYIRVI